MVIIIIIIIIIIIRFLLTEYKMSWEVTLLCDDPHNTENCLINAITVEASKSSID